MEEDQPQDSIEEIGQQQRASQPARRLRTRLFEGYLAAALLITIILAILASTRAYFSIDLTITQALQALRWPMLSGLMRVVSWFGFLPQAVVIMLAVIVVLRRLGYRDAATISAWTGILSQVINMAVKLLIQRPRPDADLVQVVNELATYSFPSGHVMFYIAYFGFLWYLAFTQLSPSWARSLALVVLSILVLLVGVSRIYLGEHWASDVLGGYLLGSLVLAGGVWFYRRTVREAE